jgi:hypothetical protein
MCPINAQSHNLFVSLAFHSIYLLEHDSVRILSAAKYLDNRIGHSGPLV